MISQAEVGLAIPNNVQDIGAILKAFSTGNEHTIMPVSSDFSHIFFRFLRQQNNSSAETAFSFSWMRAAPVSPTSKEQKTSGIYRVQRFSHLSLLRSRFC